MTNFRIFQFRTGKMLKHLQRNLSRRSQRSLMASAAGGARRPAVDQPPLTEPLFGFESLDYIDPQSVELYNTTATTLPSGLRVATEPIFGEFCTLGVAINAGSRYDANFPQGISHYLEKLAFVRTRNYDHKRLTAVLEQCGALVDCQSTRDTFLYAASCPKNAAETVMDIIADAVHRPIISEKDLEVCSEFMRNETLNMARNPECELLLIDWIHEAAFRGNTVGLSKYCQPQNIGKVTKTDVFTYLSQYYTPNRIVLASVGVEHDRLAEIGRRQFDAAQTTWAADLALVRADAPPLDTLTAQYTGGEVRIERDLSQMALGPTPYPNLAHVVLGFDGVSLLHKDYVPFCVLQTLLGGGGSFSAGGPGKGMFARLYIDVLHRYGWMYNTTAYNHSYADAGLFCIRASAPPQHINALPEIILRQFRRLTDREDIKTEELERAKTQLKSQLMMNLEMRPVMFEDLARQMLAHNCRKDATEYMESIDQVTAEDIVRAGELMLNSKLSLVAYGDLRKLASYDRIRRLI